MSKPSILFIIALLLVVVGESYDVRTVNGVCSVPGSGVFVPCQTKPRLDMRLSAGSILIGFSVTISGTVTPWNSSVTLSKLSMMIGYVTGYDTNATSFAYSQAWGMEIKYYVPLDQNGKFTLGWLPTTTGSYAIKGQLVYNGAVVEAETLALQVLPVQNQYVFAVSSNASLSSLTFNSTSNLLAFTLNGRTGDVARVDVTIAKALLPDPSRLRITANSGAVPYSSSSSDSAWVITFWATFHSPVAINLSILPPTPNYVPYVIFGVGIAAVVVTVGYMIMGRRRRAENPPSDVAVAATN